MKPKHIIKATHMRTGKTAEMIYYTIKQAKYFNPYFKDFEIVGTFKIVGTIK